MTVSKVCPFCKEPVCAFSEHSCKERREYLKLERKERAYLAEAEREAREAKEAEHERVAARKKEQDCIVQERSTRDEAREQAIYNSGYADGFQAGKARGAWLARARIRGVIEGVDHRVSVGIGELVNELEAGDEG